MKSTANCRSRFRVSTLRGLVQNRLSRSSERNLGSRSSTTAAIASYPPKRLYREAGLPSILTSPYLVLRFGYWSRGCMSSPGRGPLDEHCTRWMSLIVGDCATPLDERVRLPRL